MKKFIFLLLLFAISGGCRRLPNPFRGITKNQVIENHFKNKNLDLIEGVWARDDGSYEIAIISNSFEVYPEFDYVGVITDTIRSGLRQGEIKLLLKKTASRNVYLASSFEGKGTRKYEARTTALLTNENLLEMMLPTGPERLREKTIRENTILLRVYPQDDSYSNEKAGTGFAISEDGLIVTAYHVIKGAKIIKLYLSTDSFVSAKVLRADTANDLAILKIENLTPYFLQIAPMRSTKTGDRVFTIGFPMSSVLGQEAKYTEGVVSSTSGLEGAASFLQITVPVQPGNSGGPLLNEKGEVIGIVTSSVAILPFLKESGTLPQNVNWTVKADYLRPMIELPEIEQKNLDREQIISHIQKSVFLIEAE